MDAGADKRPPGRNDLRYVPSRDDSSEPEMRPPVPLDAGALICVQRNDVLEPFGFASGQVASERDGSVSVLYCANNIRLLAAYSGLPVPVYADSGACTDFTIENSSGPEPRVVEARLEGEGVEALVAALDRMDLLQAARAIRELPIDLALREVAKLIGEVFVVA